MLLNYYQALLRCALTHLLTSNIKAFDACLTLVHYCHWNANRDLPLNLGLFVEST